jgi:predicted transcriptional regulator of viral defense system
MNYLEFKDKMFDLACFSNHQVYAWQPDFDRNNFSHWIKRGLLIRLRQGYYSFPEYLCKPDFSMYFANRIYRPSYVSLHTALAFYGIIPEAVVQITSVPFISLPLVGMTRQIVGKQSRHQQAFTFRSVWCDGCGVTRGLHRCHCNDNVTNEVRATE